MCERVIVVYLPDIGFGYWLFHESLTSIAIQARRDTLGRA